MKHFPSSAWTCPESSDGVSSSATSKVVRVSGLSERIEIWMHTKAAAEQLLATLEEEKSDDLEPWLRADIEAGIVHVTPNLSEEFTPQLLNYDLSGLIDFKKGCYTGQEIVARMFYRGTAKRRLQLASSSQSISESSKVVARASEGFRGRYLGFQQHRRHRSSVASSLTRTSRWFRKAHDAL